MSDRSIKWELPGGKGGRTEKEGEGLNAIKMFIRIYENRMKPLT
jgi:hypothetical protein